ncbi:MAG TPA: hypothetical protein PK313_14540 [Myxococcota bacterium]|nr:hypothetical protein [Myxococcota bacterium]
MRGRVLALIVVSFGWGACGGDDCDPSGNWCEGNVLHACAADGGGRVGTECPAGTQCAGTRCYAEPVEACPSGAAEGARRCDGRDERPGTCMDDGFMLWDEGGACNRAIDERCVESIRSGPEDPGEALCGYEGYCTPGTSSCHNNVLQRCSEFHIWVTERNCGAEGMVCGNAQCK